MKRIHSWIFEICRRVTGAALALAIVLVPAVVTTRPAQAQTYIYGVLHSFAGPPDGAYPVAGLVLDSQGNLYGTTAGGGASKAGTVFKVDTRGNETVLYSFTGTGGDGDYPEAGLVLDSQGNLYGTTNKGGASGTGTVFEVDTTGKETVLYSFTGGADGANPYNSGVIFNSVGNLYGTTCLGGANKDGVVFTLSPVGGTWTETVVYSFAGGTDGACPVGSLIMDSAGNFYGITQRGGTGHGEVCNGGCGTVFKVDTSGNETVLHSFLFLSGNDGAVPNGGLVLDSQGNLYGTTYYGGKTKRYHVNGFGTVFKVEPGGTETLLYEFSGPPDGTFPVAGLVLDTQGDLYGTTPRGGAHKGGTVFMLDTAGNESVLHSFSKSGDAYDPDAGLVRDAQGNLYGTTSYGGAYDQGTVFDLLTPAAATTTTLTSAPNPSKYGQAVTFTATVAPAPPDGETVSFMKGKTVLGTGTLSGGIATFTTSTLKVGTTAVKAVYGGDSKFAGSTSNTVRQVVKKAVGQ